VTDESHPGGLRICVVGDDLVAGDVAERVHQEHGDEGRLPRRVRLFRFEVLPADDAHALLPWARRAVDAALRAAQKKPATKKKAMAKAPAPAKKKSATKKAAVKKTSRRRA